MLTDYSIQLFAKELKGVYGTEKEAKTGLVDRIGYVEIEQI